MNQREIYSDVVGNFAFVTTIEINGEKKDERSGI